MKKKNLTLLGKAIIKQLKNKKMEKTIVGILYDLIEEKEASIEIMTSVLERREYNRGKSETLNELKKELLTLLPKETKIYRKIFDDAQDTYLDKTTNEWHFFIESFSEYLTQVFHKIKSSKV
jgi:hypothetical protein